jgi:hypothetical protein
VDWDPIGFKGGDSGLYSYSLLDPINNSEPTGNSCVVGCACIGNMFLCTECDSGKWRPSLVGGPLMIWVNHPGRVLAIVECKDFWSAATPPEPDIPNLITWSKPKTL